MNATITSTGSVPVNFFTSHPPGKKGNFKYLKKFWMRFVEKSKRVVNRFMYINKRTSKTKGTKVVEVPMLNI